MENIEKLLHFPIHCPEKCRLKNDNIVYLNLNTIFTPKASIEYR